MAIENISDTARWVAYYRAMETERPDALFRDPFAIRLAGERGERIVKELPHGRSAAWGMIVRTAVFDEIILDTIAENRVELVVNLAAGLDARPWRLPLPKSLRWVDVDLPEILHYKARVIGEATPNCQYETATTDLTDASALSALFGKLRATAMPALVIAEGLLIYLTAEQVNTLARELHAVPNLRWWLIDLTSPVLLQMLNRDWGRTLQRGNAPYQFAPENGTEFFRPSGWREAKFRSAYDEARRLKRQVRQKWLWRFRLWRALGSPSFTQLHEIRRRMFGFVLLESEKKSGSVAGTPHS